MTTGELIKQARQDAKMTQKQLGEKCGIADSAIRKYESGRVVPKICTIKKIANALNVPWYKLLSNNSQDQFEILISDQNRMLEKIDKARDEQDKLLHEMAVELGKERHFNKSNAAAMEAYRSIKSDLDRLNVEGLKKANERVHELTEVPRYKRKSTPEE